MGKIETKRKAMEAIVRTYHSSSLKRKEFAAKQGMHIDKLNYWIRKIKEGGQKGSFIPIELSANKIECTALEICYPNGIIIKTGNSPAWFINQLIKIYSHV
jgi:hypothetical protein